MRLPTTVLICSLVTIALTSFLPERKKEHSVKDLDIPGVVQINDELYMDQNEVTNFNWVEYLYWTKTIYGANSPEYKAALPDTSLWSAESPKTGDAYKLHYLRHRAYRDYPVVGLSYRQMTDFCQWRSDRVFEYQLIKLGKIEFDTLPTPDNFFTTEKYLRGEYRHYKKDAAIDVVPYYYLPGEAEWNRADVYNRAIYDALSEKQRTRRNPDVYYAKYCLEDPVQPVRPSTKYAVKGAIYNLHRNVSEQLADSTLAAGENWKQHLVTGESENTFSQPGASVTKGFRCAFKWKRAI